MESLCSSIRMLFWDNHDVIRKCSDSLDYTSMVSFVNTVVFWQTCISLVPNMELTVDRDREEFHYSILQPFHRWIHVHIGGFAW